MNSSVSTAPHHALLVLFADGDADTREMYQFYFTSRGLMAEVACDGAEAVEKAAALEPDVIVLDIRLPVMDGFEVCRAVRQDARTARTPVVALTGYSPAEAREKARQAGFDLFLLKPCGPDRLFAEICRLAGSTSRPSSPACPPRTSSRELARRT